MRSQVRRYLHSRLFAAVLLSGVLTAAGSVAAGVTLFRGYMERAVAASKDEALNRIGLFGLMMEKLLRDGSATGHRALYGIADRYPTAASALAAGREGMRRAANDFGVDEVYFIGEDGKVFATSFEPDQGLDLFSVDESFAAFLKGLFRTGTQVDQGISGSTQTGNMNAYQYLAPAGRPYIIEVSTRMRTMVGAAYPGYDYTVLADQVLGGGPEATGRSPVQIVDYLNADGLSIVSERRSNPEVARRAAGSAALPDLLNWREGSHHFMLERFDLPVFSSLYRYYVLFRVDKSYYFRFVAASGLLALLAMAGATLVSFLGARTALGPHLTNRLESLASAMELVARGEAAQALEDGLDDELSAIGRQAAAMVARIREDGAELKAFARRLEEEIVERERKENDLAKALERNAGLLREVDHRVKNNLQLMVSFARLESADATAEVASLLGKMELRFLGMAQVQDQIMAHPDPAMIEMQPLLEDLLSRAAQQHGPGIEAVSRVVQAKGVFLRADAATTFALAACELADNAFRHAFQGGRPGRFRLSLSASGEGYVLEAEDDGTAPEAGIVEGMGLTIVRALASTHGGSIEIGSPATGEGILVRMRLRAST